MIRFIAGFLVGMALVLVPIGSKAFYLDCYSHAFERDSVACDLAFFHP